MKRRQKKAPPIHNQCMSFVIDVTIQKPLFIHKKKLQNKREKIKQLKKMKAEYEVGLYLRVTEKIHAKVSKNHCYGDLEVVVEGVPQYMWQAFTRGWQNYIPKRRRKDFNKYKKTHSAKRFCRSFPGVSLNKQLTGIVMYCLY